MKFHLDIPSRVIIAVVGLLLWIILFVIIAPYLVESFIDYFRFTMPKDMFNPKKLVLLWAPITTCLLLSTGFSLIVYLFRDLDLTRRFILVLAHHLKESFFWGFVGGLCLGMVFGAVVGFILSITIGLAYGMYQGLKNGLEEVGL